MMEGPTGLMAPAPEGLQGMDAESINCVLELLVAPLQAAVPQPTEVVLHDLQRIPDTVRAIAGVVTGRRIGDPPTDKLLERVAAGDLSHEIGYRSQLPDGRILQSSTIIYTDKDGRAAAALCLNTDVSAWVSLRAAMDRFVLGHESAPAQSHASMAAQRNQASSAPANGSEYFPHSVEDLSGRLIEAAIAAVGVPPKKMRKEHKVEVVAELDRRGFFLIKQAAETAAAALGVTRFTIYNYLNEVNGTSEAGD
ncbi:putative transcriptional regulator YheO [Pseudarthrobacter sp. PvP004]|uniref:helix-turn-helix transcriptional regulator n=1 Tax=Pseudarthrobacter sp. PvP004 TaxID=2817850 RepID=UPI001AEA0D11|nr:PAS domain-containing protein [Pseudarthrobacter sp. PvP004]MBP2266358.1 putative transcriptional regulator YheO [Pseudarthrobacter sp. PvP004]